MNRELRATDVAIGLIRRGDVYLVGQRAGDTVLTGCAEFPGGKCLPGESLEACVQRECEEETGLPIRVIGLRREVIHDYPHGQLRLAFFDCEVNGAGEPRPPFRWVDRRDLATLPFPEANREIIAEMST